jgi:hypothetical protein
MRSTSKKRGIDGRLAAGELHDAAGHRPLVAQRLQHPRTGLEIRLVDVAGGVGVGEAHRAGQVAAVGQVDVGQAGVAGVQVAQAAIVRAACGGGDRRDFPGRGCRRRSIPPSSGTGGVGIDDVAEFAVGGADFSMITLPSSSKIRASDELGAFRAERLGGLGKALAQGLDGDPE